MPYYSELGLSGLPSSSAYSSLFVPGPYSNHSSLLASNFSHPKPLPRQYRGGYKPHLSTISELRRINSPNLLYQSSPKVIIRPIKKINTADIDVSVNKYKKYDKYEKPKTDNIERKTVDQPLSKSPSPKRSPRASLEDKETREAKPNPKIRRDRATVRLHTVHKDTLQNEIGAMRSWRDNFKPEELDFKPEEVGSSPKKMKKTPGEILKEKFLIRSRSKENILKPESRKVSRKKSIRKSPSFHDICESITSDNIDVDLNPGQPEAIQRKQSRQISSEKILKQIRRTSTTLSEDDLKILDAILTEQNKLNDAETETTDEGVFESRGSVRKKKVTKKKSSGNLSLEEDEKKLTNRVTKSRSREKLVENGTTSPLERRPTKKRLRRPSLDDSVEEQEKTDPLTEEIYKNVIRDISQVEIEQTAFKPKPVITGSGDIEETKPSLKAVVNKIEVKETPTPKKEKKFRFNVIVEVEDEEKPKSRSATPEPPKLAKKISKISADKFNFTNDNRGVIQFPKGKKPVISSILKKRPPTYTGQVIQENDTIIKKEKVMEKPGNLNADEALKNENKIVNNGECLDDNKKSLTADENKNTEFQIESKFPVRLQKSISSSSNSKEGNPTPASPTVKEKNLFNKILSKKDDSPIVIGKYWFEEKCITPPSSPIPNVQESDDTSVTLPSPITKRQIFFNKGTTPPSSPLIKNEPPTPPTNEILNKQLNRRETPLCLKTDNENLINKEIFESDSVKGIKVNEKEESPISSPLIKKENVFNKEVSKNEEVPSSPTNMILSKGLNKGEENPPASPKISSENFLNKQILSTVNDVKESPFSPHIKGDNVFNNQILKNEETLSSPTTKIFNKGLNRMEETPPGSPKIKSENFFNKKMSETIDDSKESSFTSPSSSLSKRQNLFNKQISKNGDAPFLPITKVLNEQSHKKEDTFSDSPKIINEDLFKTKMSKTANDIPRGVKGETAQLEKDENDNTIDISAENLEKSENEKKLISKRSLVQKANKDDPDLVVFVPPEPEPQQEPEPEPEEKKDVFVPLQSNRLSQWMHPWKKPQQFDVCPVEIYARPKVIRGRHYPRPRGHPAPGPPKSEDSSSEEEEEEEEETEEETSSEEETSEEESEEESATNNKIGASTSSNDSGFGSGALGSNKDCDVNIHKKCEKLTANLCGVNQKLVVEAIESVRKGSLESRDSPTSNHANNPAFALDSGDIPEEYSQSSTFTGFQKSGRITPPATTIPRFRKYCLDDFNFLKVLGKGSFGKVLLAELKGTEYYYAVKCLKKDVVLEDDDVECTLIERKVLALGTKHPYLCHLLCTFQTESHLFFVMEYLNGGDLMFHIQASGRFPEHQAKFYGAEIVSGLKFLHNKGIVYRDLKLDNVLLDFDGHVRIADFGMCKLQIFLDRMAETFCGTPDYMAPEIIKGQHYNQNVDWWSFGVLLYEMLLGQSPFSGCDEDELFWSICNEKPVLPRYLTAEAVSVLTLFLEKDASKRLGNRFSPHGDIQDQPFFKSIDWYALEARQLEPPFKPNLQHPLDTQYFDKHFTVEKAKLTPIDTAILQSMDQTQFQGFSYTNPNATDK